MTLPRNPVRRVAAIAAAQPLFAVPQENEQKADVEMNIAEPNANVPMDVDPEEQENNPPQLGR